MSDSDRALAARADYRARDMRPRADQARLLRLVEAGADVREAALQIGYAPKSIQHWRSRYPDFREALDRAKRDGRTLHPMKWKLLDAMASGLSARQASALVGVCESAARNWCRTDPSFAARYRRLAARRRSGGAERQERFFAAIEAGLSVRAACKAAGYHYTAPYRWRVVSPALWERFRRIVEGEGEEERAA